MNTWRSHLRVFIVPLVAWGVLSCDLRDKNGVGESEGTVSLAPRLVTSSGDSVAKVDSVRFVVTYGSVTRDTTVGFSAHKLSIGDIPVGSRWTMKVQGIHVASDGVHKPVWWSGSKSGTASSTAGTVDWTTTVVILGDTTAPVLSAQAGIPSSGDSTLTYGSSSVTVSFQDTSASDHVYRNDTALAAVSGVYSFTFWVSSAATTTIVLKVVDTAGNVTQKTLKYSVSTDPKTDTAPPTIAFSSPSKDTIFTTSPAKWEVTVESVSSSGIDSVVIGSKTLQKYPWSDSISLSAGPNQVKATVYGKNGKTANANLTITLPSLSTGDVTAPRITLESPAKKRDTVAWSVKSVDLSWKVWDSAGVAGATLNSSSLGSSSADGVWSSTQTLGVGLNTFAFWAKDPSGNSSVDTVFVYRMADTSHPVVSWQGTRKKDTVAFKTPHYDAKWTVTDLDSVKGVQVNGTPLSVTSDSLYTLALVLRRPSKGYDTTLHLVAFDFSGDTTRDTVSLHVRADTSHPAIVRTTSITNTTTVLAHETTSYAVSWTVTDLDTLDSVTINGKAATANGNIYSATIDLSKDTVPVVVVAKDSAGNVSRDSICLIVAAATGDTVVPVVTRVSPENKLNTVPWLTKTMAFAWTITDNVGVVSVVNKSKTLVAPSSGSVWRDTQSLSAGLDTFVLVAKDSAANARFDTVVVFRQADTSLPVVSLQGMRKKDTVAFKTSQYNATWKVTDLDSVASVVVNGASLSASDSSYTLTASLRKASLGYDTTFALVATDRAGNFAYDTVHLHVLADTSHPVATRASYTKDTTIAFKTTTYKVSWTVADLDAVNSVKINGVTATSSGSTYYRTLTLSADSLPVVLVATDMAGNTTKDSVTLTRNMDTSTALTALSVTSVPGGKLSQTFVTETLSYTDTVSMSTLSITMAATTGSAYQTVTFGGSSSGIVAVAADGAVNVVVTNTNSNTSRTYVINVIHVVAWVTTASYGTVTDSRDGKTYRTVKIGTQTWMAQNLNYSNNKGSSDTVGLCYENSSDSCSKYGRTYSWSQSMGLDSTYDNSLFGNAAQRQGVCPSGWHLPSNDEWVHLTDTSLASATPGPALKSTEGWNYSLNGSDSVGFRALPGGYGSLKNGTLVFQQSGNDVEWWSSSEYIAGQGTNKGINSQGIGTGETSKSMRAYVRCVKD